jgi:hypothetical protein
MSRGKTNPPPASQNIPWTFGSMLVCTGVVGYAGGHPSPSPVLSLAACCNHLWIASISEQAGKLRPECAEGRSDSTLGCSPIPLCSAPARGGRSTRLNSKMGVTQDRAGKGCPSQRGNARHHEADWRTTRRRELGTPTSDSSATRQLRRQLSPPYLRLTSKLQTDPL